MNMEGKENYPSIKQYNIISNHTFGQMGIITVYYWAYPGRGVLRCGRRRGLTEVWILEIVSSALDLNRHPFISYVVLVRCVFIADQ